MNGGHDQHIGGVAETAKWIIRHGFAIEGDVGAHFTLILKINISAVKNANGFTNVDRTIAFGVSECRISQQGHARFMSKGARSAGGLHGNIRQLFPIGHVGDIGVGDHNCAPSGNHHC